MAKNNRIRKTTDVIFTNTEHGGRTSTARLSNNETYFSPEQTAKIRKELCGLLKCTCSAMFWIAEMNGKRISWRFDVQTGEIYLTPSTPFEWADYR